MKKHASSLKNWLLASATTLLGLNVGCHGTALMYGTPWADFEVKGRVTNQQGHPLQGISISVLSDSALSNQAGRYNLKFCDVPWADIPLHVNDIDGPANGSYRDTVINISAKDVDFEDGDNDWYVGHATILHDIVLEDKE